MKKMLSSAPALLVGVVLVLLALFLAAKPAAAGTDWMEFEAFNIQCSVEDPGEQWVSDDGILHIRDMVYRAVVVSESPTHNGTARIVASVNRDLATGFLTLHSTLEIHPVAYPDGYWSGVSSMQINDGRAGGIARLRGYGELEGRLIKAELTPLPPQVLAGFAYACDGNMPLGGVRSQGVVMTPGGE
jgi:hypothetical protein